MIDPASRPQPRWWPRTTRDLPSSRWFSRRARPAAQAGSRPGPRQTRYRADDDSDRFEAPACGCSVAVGIGPAGPDPGRVIIGSRGVVDALIQLAVEEDWIEAGPAPAASDPLGPARQVRRLREAPENALVLVDDLTVDQGLTLFGQLRDELWQTPVSCTAAVRPDVAQALSVPPADVFFDQRVSLEPFGGEDANELLQRRKQAGESTLISIVEPGRAWQPRALVARAGDEPPGGRYDPLRQYDLMELARDAAGRPGEMLLGEMWGREGVSASDEALQRSLGVTRNRLTELLRKLAGDGVLTAYPEPREGRTGRPRMIYTVLDP